MLVPSDIEELKGNNSRYAVVVGVAKEARKITEEAAESKEILIEKPVSIAIKEFKDGDCTLIVPSEEDEQE